MPGTLLTEVKGYPVLRRHAHASQSRSTIPTSIAEPNSFPHRRIPLLTRVMSDETDEREEPCSSENGKKYSAWMRVSGSNRYSRLELTLLPERN